jgi:hypothetical protein
MQFYHGRYVRYLPLIVSQAAFVASFPSFLRSTGFCLPASFRCFSLFGMDKVQEIEAAIRNLSPVERSALIADLPSLLPELDGDAVWESIVGDGRPRAALSSLLNDIQSAFREDPHRFPEMKDEDLEG